MVKDKIKQIFKEIPLFLIFFILLLVVSISFIIHMDKRNIQSSNPVPPDVVFVGDYKVGDGDWKEYDGTHIPIIKGEDVTLNGYFMLIDPANNEKYPVSKGLVLALYLNHVNVKIYNDEEMKVELFCEVKAAGESSCGETWQYYSVTTEAYEPITIVISNPHIYGNDNAIDDMLGSLSLYYYTNFELMILRESRLERALGLLVMFWGMVIVLVGLVSYLLKIKRIKSIFSIGLAVFFGGLYLFFCTRSISIYFDSISSNTIIVELAGMFYYFFLMKVFSDYLCDKKKIFGMLAIINSGIAILVSILVTIFTDLYFFDMWLLWAIIQGVSFILLTVGVVFNIKDYNLTRKIAYPIFIVSFLTYILDTIFSGVGGFEETGFSQFSFILVFLIAIVAILTSVPKNVNNVLKAKQLETEKIALNSKLQESRVLLMISQIQPHFLYNILNTIYHLCDKDIELAKKAVDEFSTYLRNNINSLSTTELISFDTELEHIKTYINLEKIRFGEELNVVYDIQTSDFYLPILSIQPLVENAVKHGVSKRRGGGKVTISSYEDDLNYIISIIDTGVGYDLNQITSDGKSHIGIQNVKDRLDSRVDGKLILESEIGVGTKAIVYIPKKELK
jgi:sensor histidine kinase YesM